MLLAGNSIILDFYYIDIDNYLNFLLHLKLETTNLKYLVSLSIWLNKN